MDLKSKNELLENFSKKYKSGIYNLIKLLNNKILEKTTDKSTFLDILSILKKNGFEKLTEMIKENGNNYPKDSFKEFLLNLYKATKVYDKYNGLTPSKYKFMDYMEMESKKTIKKSYEDFANILINSNQKFDLKIIDKLANNLNIDYQLSKQDIKEHWDKNNFYYLKNQFQEKPLKINSSSKEFENFFIHSLKNNNELLINNIEKLSIKNKDTDHFKHIINLINNTIENNNKINKIDNIVNILSDISDKVSYKIDLLKEKIEKNEVIYEEFKEEFNNTNKDSNSNKLIQANLLKEESNREINSNINEIKKLNKDLINNIKSLDVFKENNIDRD